MLESEYEELRIIHPEYARRWDAFLETWADKKGLPESFLSWGLWRWRALPPKMRELCKSKGIYVNDDYTLRTVPVRMTKDTFEKKEGTTMEPKMENRLVRDLQLTRSARISRFSETSFTSTTQQPAFHRTGD